MALLTIDDKAPARANKNWLAIARVNGEVVGMMVYELKGTEVTKFTFRATRFYYTTSQGKYLLLEWIARHVNQANEGLLFLPPYERPETWLADMDVASKPLWRPPMGRVVNVAGISGLVTGPGQFTARIIDPLCPWNEGVWAFETVDGRLNVRPAEKATLSLTIQGLSALVYGTHSVEDFSIRGWGNPSFAEQEILESIFPSQNPYLHLFF